MTTDPHKVPIVSAVLPDGTMIEALYNGDEGKTVLAVREPERAIRLTEELRAPSGELLVPYSGRNNLLASGCILLPSEVGDVGDKEEVLGAIREYLHRYVDLAPGFEELAAYYVLLTWTYDAFSELPYLRFRGDFGTGKTRALLTVGSVCYKPFFASGASTVSPIFHILDAFRGTLVLDEADFRFTDATADLTKILNNGSVNGLPVLRTMANRHRELNPQAFRVFGPKLIAMRKSFQDDGLESRFLTAETGGRALRPDIPIHVPRELAGEALRLRNRLLAWRFENRRSIAPDPARLMRGVAPRLNQTALALLSLVDAADARERIEHQLLGAYEGGAIVSSVVLETEITVALLESTRDAEGAAVTVGDVTRRFNTRVEEMLGEPRSSKWVGWCLRTCLRLNTIRSHGVYVVPTSERPRIDALARRHDVLTRTNEQRHEEVISGKEPSSPDVRGVSPSEPQSEVQ